MAEHFLKERKLRDKGIKVLSLFFIDRVANYRDYDAAGVPVKGKFADWFEEIYKEVSSKSAYKDLIPFDAQEVHNGYFSADKKGKWKDTKGNTQADDDTFKLIMKNKEKLLSIDEPLRFIFSHSALREGWDNPNVFQICTLNETQSELKKRQEIGRGLRLSVNQEGMRIQDTHINRLTVVANESYEVLVNPQLFLDNAVIAIKDVLTELLIDGIKYEKVGSKEYEMRLFEDYEIHVNDLTFDINKQDKTIYSNLVPLDSNVEYEFAKECESRDDIAFYFKLPFWFNIKTPIGNYNPDWALIKKNEKTVYFVAETKSAGQELRTSEK